MWGRIARPTSYGRDTALPVVGDRAFGGDAYSLSDRTETHRRVGFDKLSPLSARLESQPDHAIHVRHQLCGLLGNQLSAAAGAGQGRLVLRVRRPQAGAAAGHGAVPG